MTVREYSNVTEASLKSAFCQQARAELKGFVVIRHEDRFTHGIPDTSVTGRKKTSWWEAKYANPHFQSKGIQELTMLRLGVAGFAFYVLYYEKGEIRRTYIVDPPDIGKDVNSWTRYADGFNHKWVIEFIKEVHK
jgi:hypothetical protein